MITVRCRQEHIADAAALFIAAYERQRQLVPVLPDHMAHTACVTEKLAQLLRISSGVVAVENGHVLGYLLWYLVPNFRDTPRLGAYVPEWGHATVDKGKTAIYRMLYRAAAEQWAAAGCRVHAITLLAWDQEAQAAWFWQGFGLTVVDALRPVRPLSPSPQSSLTIRRAAAEDAAALAALDAEHWRHYARSPIFMPPRDTLDAAGNIAFLSRPKNSVWLACDGDAPVGFMRFDGYDFDGVAIVESDQAVAVTGAYIAPPYRRRQAAASLLDAGLRYYEARGLRSCALNFESFNPEAVTFWPRYFEPVCHSLLRVPET